jgi:hypothetical protein
VKLQICYQQIATRMMAQALKSRNTGYAGSDILYLTVKR